MRFFPYSWHIDKNQTEVTVIRAYGLDENNKNVCVRIEGFTPYCYVELSDDLAWTESLVKRVANAIDEQMGEQRPLKKELKRKKRLYYAHYNREKERYNKFSYLFLAFSSDNDRVLLQKKLRYGFYVPGLGKKVFRVHEANADPILQMICRQDIPTAGWIEFKGKEITHNKMTICDHEYSVKWNYLKKAEDIHIVPKPLIMSFDIEVNSTNVNAMPNPDKPGDKVFQISCILSRQGDKESDFKKYILTLGTPDQQATGEDVIIQSYKTESSLLIGYRDFIMEHNPNIIAGYNILGFDIEYMIKRAKFNFCMPDFDRHGFIPEQHAEEKIIKWSSSAVKNQEFLFLDAEGRLFVDLLPLVRRDYRMDNYKLKTISDFFLGETKDPLTAKGIFKCYRDGMKKDKDGKFTKYGCKALGVVAKYCVQDSVLVTKLIETLQTWIGLTEMAKVCNVPILTLYTQGQQIKVFSQVYKICMGKNYVVEKDGYVAAEDEHYQGAYVFDPVPGRYEKVIPFDFTSLYPTTIIAYNICWSTLVIDPNIPDRHCHVIEWHDHLGCEHDTVKRKTAPKHVMCAKRKYRFLKEPIGILPGMLKYLLDTRKKTKKEMKALKMRIKSEDLSEEEKTFLETQVTVLDKRQLSYKISANSAYGALGVHRGRLPFMPGAMCTTAKGREAVQLAAKTIVEKHRGELIYGDTDCVAPTTPLMIDEDGKIAYKTAEEISDGNWSRINSNKEISQAKPGYKIWSDQGFTKIKNVVRCGVKKPVSRILVHTGHVICSNEHSLLRENLESVKPCDLNLKEKLCITNLPLPEDTPKKPIYPNNLTAEKIKDYKISDEVYENLSAKEAFVWGVFFADGSCGIYQTKTGVKTNWTINKADTTLLKRCQEILQDCETYLNFNILDTIKSSKVYKLAAIRKSRKKEHDGTLQLLVNKYRKLFYNDRKLKKIPDILFNAPYKIREAFFMGYYAGDGSKKDPALCITNKGEIGTAGLFFIMKSIGYQVSINTRKDKPDTYKLTGSTSEKKQRYAANAIKKIEDYSNDFDYIYDIETENHHFAAGVGEMVVHNSCYIRFPHLDKANAQEIWEYSEEVADEVSKLYRAPMKLEFEEVIYWVFFILTKKRYMSLPCGKDGIVSKKISKKGVLLARRDNSRYVREVYSDIIMKVFHKENRTAIEESVLEHIQRLFTRQIPNKWFIITKSVGDVGIFTSSNDSSEYLTERKMEYIKYKGAIKKDDKGNPETRWTGYIGDYKVTMLHPTNEKKRNTQITTKGTEDEKEFYLRSLPAQVQLAEKIRRRGKRVDPGSRMEFLLTTDNTHYSAHKAKLWEKNEDIEYFNDHSDILRIDNMYYLKNLTTPLDQVLEIIDTDMIKFTEKQYKLRMQKIKYLESIKELSRPKMVFQE